MGLPPHDHLWRRPGRFIHFCLAWSTARMGFSEHLDPRPTRIDGHHSAGAACGLYGRDDARCGGAGSRVAARQRTGLLRRSGDMVGVNLDGEVLEGDAVVIAMGPWSVLAAQWLPLPPVFGLKGHSLVFETGTAISSEALFLEYVDATGSILSPEIFPRADGTTYVCAISSDSPFRQMLVWSCLTMVRLPG